MVDDSNIKLTSFRTICNYIRDEFGKSAILCKESVQSLGTGFMKEDYGTYWYEKDEVMENMILTSDIDRLTVFLPLRYPIWCAKN